MTRAPKHFLISPIAATVTAVTLMAGAHGAIFPHPQAEAQALDLAKQAIALRSVRGPGNKTPEVAALYKTALVAGGLAEAQITISTVDDTAYLMARWPGTEPKLKTYYEVRITIAAGEAMDTARARAQASLATLRDAHQASLK